MDFIKTNNDDRDSTWKRWIKANPKLTRQEEKEDQGRDNKDELEAILEHQEK